MALTLRQAMTSWAWLESLIGTAGFDNSVPSCAYNNTGRLAQPGKVHCASAFPAIDGTPCKCQMGTQAALSSFPHPTFQFPGLIEPHRRSSKRLCGSVRLYLRNLSSSPVCQSSKAELHDDSRLDLRSHMASKTLNSVSCESALKESISTWLRSCVRRQTWNAVPPSSETDPASEEPSVFVFVNEAHYKCLDLYRKSGQTANTLELYYCFSAMVTSITDHVLSMGILTPSTVHGIPCQSQPRSSVCSRLKVATHPDETE
ncbi:hypothetical protein M8818_004594 [Zalaria obscura]|uniref:Uncharacterized protein n=1 Tax=Zalaria obscura TaxID=2024903 RepID=A0ACC3SBL0_9PEZI